MKLLHRYSSKTDPHISQKICEEKEKRGSGSIIQRKYNEGEK